MSNIKYRQVMEIRPYGKGGKKKKKKGRGMARREEYDGVISNTNLDSYNTHIGVRALKTFAKDARKGVPVLALHDRNTQIGRSTGGTFSNINKDVTAEFYIQRGLPLNGPGYANSDAYIDSVDEGTMRDLSVGFVPKQESCDYCGTEMKRYNWFGISLSECENGHYPGQKIFVDKNGKQVSEPKKGLREITITSTINEADLKEFSVVPFGATPGAEVAEKVKRAFQEGAIEEKHRVQLNEEYQIRFDTRSNEPLIDEFLKSMGRESTSKQKSGGQRMATTIENRDELIQEMISDARTDEKMDQANALSQIASERDELFDTIEEYKDKFGGEDRDIEQNFIKLNEEIKKLRNEDSRKSAIEDEYYQLLDGIREQALEEYERKCDNQVSPTERERIEKRLQSTDSFFAIDELRSAWKASADAKYIYQQGRVTRDMAQDPDHIDELYKKDRFSSNR